MSEEKINKGSDLQSVNETASQSQGQLNEIYNLGVKVSNQIPIKNKPSLLSSSLAAAQEQDTTKPILIGIKQLRGVPEEPSLFATSVGDNYSGRLVPSSSTISLFSLNNENSIDDSKPLQQQQQQQNYSAIPSERKNSFTQQQPRLNSTSSINSNALHKQRHQHYMAALTPISSSASTPTVKKLSIFDKTTSPKQIPNPSTYPPEPNLEPTSLGGSPSMFYLSSKTPPASLNNSSTLQNFIKLQQQQQLLQQGINIDVSDKSPDLIPMGTPKDMPPMTPLLLNNNLEEFRFTTATTDSNRDWE